MTFQDSIQVCFKKYADFTGTAVRSEFWWFVLFTFIVNVAFSMFSSILAGLFGLAVLLPSLAVGARRLHDTGKSGWWQLLYLIPLLGWIIVWIMMAQPGKGSAFTD